MMSRESRQASYTREAAKDLKENRDGARNEYASKRLTTEPTSRQLERRLSKGDNSARKTYSRVMGRRSGRE